MSVIDYGSISYSDIQKSETFTENVHTLNISENE